ncbi:MAG: hypothetical protein MJA84_07205 [Firmicutes bacterium]|nr:hypothetical protein [Bacillota bacterium]
MKKIFDIQFKGTEELIHLAEQRSRLLAQNVETAVADTVLLAISLIAGDANFPVDTGRLRASIAGDLADAANVVLKGDPQAIKEGKAASVTDIDGLWGRIGTNVEYALYQEYGIGGRETGRASRSGATLYSGFRGKGFFRKSIPVLDRHFKKKMREAIDATREGRLLREG